MPGKGNSAFPGRSKMPKRRFVRASPLRLAVTRTFALTAKTCSDKRFKSLEITPLQRPDMNKRNLSERDICTKFITPAVKLAGWDEMNQIREEVSFTKGRIIVRGKLVTHGS
jgi:hypothetical protein